MDKYTGIIGFGSIAKIHSRIMYENNNPINFVFTRSKSRIQKIKNFFKKEFSYVPEIVNDCNIFFSKKICSLVISSPPSTHFNYLLKAFDRKITVFCEKPLFWEKNTSFKELEKKINIIESHKNKNFLVNTSNSYFLKSLVKNISTDKITKLKFVFHTNGSSRFEEISEDLLPHGISILIETLGFSKIKNVKKKITNSLTNYKFEYSDAKIEFEFKEDKSLKKKMIIEINDHKFTRIQNGKNSSYSVCFRKDDGTMIENLEDPFVVYNKLFLEGFTQHKKDIFNLRLMNDLIKGLD